jgi:hypothetical protein
MLGVMRLAIRVLATVLFLAAAAHGEEPPPPPPPTSIPVSVDRPPSWYARWSLILGGSAMTLVGTALTPLDPPDSPLSAKNQTGWALVGIGTATWIGGVLLLRFSGSRPSPNHR